jgi:hypothetical protein
MTCCLSAWAARLSRGPGIKITLLLTLDADSYTLCSTTKTLRRESAAVPLFLLPDLASWNQI